MPFVFFMRRIEGMWKYKHSILIIILGNNNNNNTETINVSMIYLELPQAIGTMNVIIYFRAYFMCTYFMDGESKVSSYFSVDLSWAYSHIHHLNTNYYRPWYCLVYGRELLNDDPHIEPRDSWEKARGSKALNTKYHQTKILQRSADPTGGCVGSLMKLLPK